MLKTWAKKGKELVRVADGGFARLRTRAGEIISGRDWMDLKPVVQVEGWVKIVARERGKLSKKNCRDFEHNIWTTTGREYLALLMSYNKAVSPTTLFRNDRINYIGVGTGTQVEAPEVTRLVTPVAYSGSDFLAPIVEVPDFPLNPARTTVRYRRLFTESEISIGAGSLVYVSELGLFTDGSPTASYAPGTRSVLLSNAAAQPPMAYKTFEPIGKTDALQLEVFWEIRF